jgi:hypothetical protein
MFISFRRASGSEGLIYCTPTFEGMPVRIHVTSIKRECPYGYTEKMQILTLYRPDLEEPEDIPEVQKLDCLKLTRRQNSNLKGFHRHSDSFVHCMNVQPPC